VKYTIHIDTGAAKSLAKMPRKVQRQIGRKIDALADDPFPTDSKSIKGAKDLYRIRSGNYRIAYKVKAGKLLILVIRIGHRKDFYCYFDR